MASNDRNAENSTNLLTELAARSTHGIGEIGKAQMAAVDRCQQSVHHWLQRWQNEAKLLMDFGAKLATARSIPEIDRRWEMASEDAKRIVDDSQALILTGTQLFTNGSRLQSLSS